MFILSFCFIFPANFAQHWFWNHACFASVLVKVRGALKRKGLLEPRRKAQEQA